MRTAPLLLALVAAIMLVISGVPARASTGDCNPCPPHCPMMAKAHQAQAHHSGKPLKADSGCGQSAICQAMGALTALPSASAKVTAPAGVAIILENGVQLALASRLPDRSLRPPIRL